jgi:hypothetical protein
MEDRVASPENDTQGSEDRLEGAARRSSGRLLPRGLKLPVMSRDAQTVTVSYLDQPQVIPITATDLH